MASAYGPRRTWNAAPGRGGSGRKYKADSSALDGGDVFDFPESDGEDAAPRVTSTSKRVTKKRTPSVKSTTSESDAAPNQPVANSRQKSGGRHLTFDFPGSDDERPQSKKAKHGLSSIPEVRKTVEKSGKSEVSKDAADLRKRKRDEPERKLNTVPKTSSPKKTTSPKQTKNTVLPLGNTKPSKKPMVHDSPRRSQAISSKSKVMQSKQTTELRITRSRSRSQTPAHMVEITPTPATPKNQPRLELFKTPSPSRNLGTPTTAMKVGTATPRQTALWSKLLNADDGPENLHLSSLRLSKPISSPGLVESSSEAVEMPTPKRMRLVDMLKDSGRPSEPETDSEESEEEIEPEFEAEVEEVVEVETQITSRPSGSQTIHRSKVRYGQQRSYIADQDENVLFDMLIEDSARQEGKSSQKTDLDMESDDDESTQLRSIQDLRAAGSKKRMLDELQSLISGVKGEVVSSISAQRFDLLELANKLVDPVNAQAFLDHGLEHQLLETFAKSTDTIFNFLAATCLVCIIKYVSNLGAARAMHRSGWLARLFELLDLDQDISRTVRDRRYNMSKIAQSSVIEFKAVILKSEFWGETVPEQLTPNILGLRAIELLVRRMRELGSDDVLLDEKAILQLLDYSGSESDPEQRIFVLSALESNSIGGHTSRGAVSKSLGRLCQDIAFTLSSASDSTLNARNLALRLSLNLTNNNTAACAVFGVPEFVEALMKLIVTDFAVLNEPSNSSPDRLRIIDELILALGSMINLAELNDSARILVLEQEGGAVLGQTVQIFQTGLDRTYEADSVEESQANVPYGYLALLLVNLCQSDSVRTRVLALLPVAQLDRLIQAAEEFIKIFQRTDQEMRAAVGAADDDDEAEEVVSAGTDGYTNRLLGMVRRLKMIKVES